MAEDVFRSSVGILRYSVLPNGDSKLVVEVDPDIARLSRALAPRYLNLGGTRFAPHISVIRHEVVSGHPAWRKHEGETVGFEYGSYVYDDGLYYWLRVRSDALIDLRLELGLAAHSRYSRPPDGTRWFHITVGNLKQHLGHV